MKKKEDFGELQTIDEVAEYLQFGEATIRRLIKAKKLPFFRIGGQWRCKREVLDKWLEGK